MMKRLFIFSMFILASLALAACTSNTPDTASAALQEPVTQTLVVQGHLEPVYSLDLAFSLSGQVAEVLIAEGAEVSAGDILARLGEHEVRQVELIRARQEILAASQALEDLEDNAALLEAQYKANVVEARQAVEEAEKLLEEIQEESEPDQLDLDMAAAKLELVKAQFASAQDAFDGLIDGIDPDQEAALLSRLVTAEAAQAAAQSALQSLELRAPVNGTVIGLSLQEGEFITAGQPVLSLTDFSEWVIKTDDLAELEVIDVKTGQTVEIILDAFPETLMTGSVVDIASRYEEKRGDVTYTVTITLDNLVDGARWGMTGQVIFDSIE